MSINQSDERILIVEDNEEFITSVNIMLNAHGYSYIEFAKDAEEALQKIASITYAVILIDIGLPGKTDGLKLLEVIKKQLGFRTEVIMLTAWDQNEKIIEATKKGAFFYITKSKNIKDLPTILHRALDVRRKNYLLNETQKMLDKKIDELDKIFQDDEHLLKNPFDFTYFTEQLLRKIVESTPNIIATGVTDLEEKVNKWIYFDTETQSLSEIQEIDCRFCNSDACFMQTMKVPIQVENTPQQIRICNMVKSGTWFEQVQSAIYVPLYFYELDNFMSTDFNTLIDLITANKINQECLNYIWILFSAPYDKTIKDKERPFLNFLYRLVVVRRHYFNLKKRLKKQIEADKFKKVAMLASGIPHDIKPLIGKLSLNINDGNPELQDESLAILRNIRKLLDSYGNYENSIREDKYDFAKANLSDVIKDAITTSYIKEEENKIDIRFETDDTGEFTAKIDSSKIERALRNLIINSKEAILEAILRGKIEKGLIGIKLLQNGACYEIHVADNGIGFPKDRIDNPFSDFFTTKREGIGLGLNIALEIFERHSGKIAVEKECSTGTSFRCLIPRTIN